VQPKVEKKVTKMRPCTRIETITKRIRLRKPKIPKTIRKKVKKTIKREIPRAEPAPPPPPKPTPKKLTAPPVILKGINFDTFCRIIYQREPVANDECIRAKLLNMKNELGLATQEAKFQVEMFTNRKNSKEAFQSFDTDNSNAINMTEFIKGLEGIATELSKEYCDALGPRPLPWNHNDIEAIFGATDKDKDGSLTYDEFCLGFYGENDLGQKNTEPIVPWLIQKLNNR
jgi:hypothetical protein